ncbi:MULTISPECIES: hypothetical protein [Campylobacter]|uniref:hypothetical protein n=1 Tax=Campylobacter TaxID=194 RepID=UPI000A334EA1|nr:MULTISPECIES: hypothetical protein [unclassified Campylobacter]
MSKIHKNLNTIAITTRDPIEQKDALLKIIKSRSIDVIFESHVAQSISLEGYEFSELIKRAKLATPSASKKPNKTQSLASIQNPAKNS